MFSDFSGKTKDSIQNQLRNKFGISWLINFCHQGSSNFWNRIIYQNSVQKGKRWSMVMYLYYLIGYKIDACQMKCLGDAVSKVSNSKINFGAH